MKVLAAIVTHNRLRLVRRCYENLKAQSCMPSEILIIDNDSTDGTEDFFRLEKCSYIKQANTGSSGGWNTAIDYALNGDFDAIWLMDDDGYPAKSALEVLLQGFHSNDSCISSVVLNENSQYKFVFPFPKIYKTKLPVIFGIPRKYYSINSIKKKLDNRRYPYVHLFNGALISINAIRKIGNVSTEFFMFGDEVDYFYRLNRVGNVSTLFDAKHYHPDVSSRRLNKKKIYFYLRNSIILNKRYFDHYFIRSCLNIIALSLRVLKRNGLRDFLSLFLGKYKTAFFLGINHGFSGNMSNDRFS